ncbi:hypothetical protein ARALYDRAFT_481515 [Arabidopsis lyrata subsp. lyrata]|uniref:Uncharacterized protein n=1 Tax=Arabidopsis lyrata subsp. lyrata TaxID=81972 RepID=D7LE65_ARALL|nr:hypothetical protein ARALYDRAFT_481515 [Arabidopsis lyrata subsp. lyrata]
MASSLLRPTPLLSTPHKLSHLHTSLSFPSEISTQRNPHNHLLNLCRSSSTPSQQKTSQRKRTRYRKQYPGENIGITEEMRFVAMRLRNVNGKKLDLSGDKTEQEEEEDEVKEETWKPSKEGFLKYLVDSKLVFDTIERIVDESENVSYAYFRRTGLERCESLEKDLQWFRGQDLVIPEPSNIGVSYAKYLEEQAGQSAPLFLSHFYSIYFSHIAGGQVIVRQVSFFVFQLHKVTSSLLNALDISGFMRVGFVGIFAGYGGFPFFFIETQLTITEEKTNRTVINNNEILNQHQACSISLFELVPNKLVSEKLLEGKELDFNRWEGDAQDLLKGVREKLNVLGEHWTRDEKNKCLKETAKAFKYMGQIVRLIIL